MTSAEALADLAKTVGGIGPPASLTMVVQIAKDGMITSTAFTKLAHSAKLSVHPYTARVAASRVDSRRISQ